MDAHASKEDTKSQQDVGVLHQHITLRSHNQPPPPPPPQNGRARAQVNMQEHQGANDKTGSLSFKEYEYGTNWNELDK